MTGKVKIAAEKEAKQTASRKRKFSKTWEAAMRLKGSIIVNDPAFLI